MAEALRIGMGDSDKDAAKWKHRTLLGIWRPDTVKEYAKAIKEELRSQGVEQKH